MVHAYSSVGVDLFCHLEHFFQTIDLCGVVLHDQMVKLVELGQVFSFVIDNLILIFMENLLIKNLTESGDSGLCRINVDVDDGLSTLGLRNGRHILMVELKGLPT